MAAAVTEEAISLNQLTGVGPATKAKLEAMGIYDLMDLAVRSPRDLVDEEEIKMDKAVDLVNRARAILSENEVLEKDYVSADELLKRRRAIGRISAGCLSLDDLLGGGVETQAMTEFYGEFSSGKTTICQTLAVMVQQPKEKGGLGAGAVYVDTEGTFRPERVEQIAKARGYDPTRVLSNITVARAYNSAHQELIAKDVGRVAREKKARLIVVDSVAAHFRAEYLGRGTLAERQQRLNRMLHMLLRTAEVNDVAVVITNQVLASPDQFFGNPIQAIGGHVLGHTSTYRIWVRRGKEHTRIARMVDSPYQEERDAPFVLDRCGVSDVEEGTAARKKQQ